MIRPRLAASLLAFAIAATGAEPPEVLHDSAPERWGAPSRIVPPDYPAQALERRVTGHVDIEGLVVDDGTLRDVEYGASSAEAEVFIPAVKEVMSLWRFYPARGDDCMPSPKRYAVRVWFELDGDKPKISTTRRKGSEPMPPQPELKIVRRIDPVYPYAMQRHGVEGVVVYSRQEIEPDGSVSSVATYVVPNDPRLSSFAASVEKALRRWQWAPAPQGHTRRRIACYDVVFNFR